MSMSKSPVDARSSDIELPGDGPTGCPEQYHSPVLVCFHKWAKIILSLYIDKVSCSKILWISDIVLIPLRHSVLPTNHSSKMRAVGSGLQHGKGSLALF